MFRIVFTATRIIIVLLFINTCLVAQVVTSVPKSVVSNNESYISISFDNDTYYYTDYYYTYGLEIDLGLPLFSKTPWNRIFLKVKNSSCNTSGISLSQRLFTPKNIRDTLVQFNDRPFAATLELVQYTFSYNNNTGLKIQ